ncbi:bacterio-opsin activator domain-containing protein [Halobellus litoreus]|uniref:Bacterio-opsin activator domain-containing protein n=1 Tax=Halobellus litoreus TaxID=755310 RepID=A0ABD6DU17_9EURY|nr:bacterio-opsin activator domain-containing protein [Halobellus litoreus]
MANNPPADRDAPVSEIEFALRGSKYPFVALSDAENCAVELVGMLPREGDRYAEFFNVNGADPQRVLALVDEYETVEASLLSAYDDIALFEFLVSDGCPAQYLGTLGGLPRTARATDGEGRIVAEVPAQYDTGSIVDDFLDAYPDADLTGKREKAGIDPMFSGGTYRQLLSTQLTDKQREVVETAFEAGYYEWPREATGEEVAEELGIASATFSEQIHAAERKLLAALLEDTE